MKKSIIKDLFYELMDFVTNNLNKGGEDKEKDSELFEKIKESFSPEMIRLHNEYVNEAISDACEETNMFFEKGFKLGLLLGLECAAE